MSRSARDTRGDEYRRTDAAREVHDSSTLLVEQSGPLGADGLDLQAGCLACLGVHDLVLMRVLVEVRPVGFHKVMSIVSVPVSNVVVRVRVGGIGHAEERSDWAMWKRGVKSR